MCKMEDTRNGRNSSNFYCRNYKTTSSKCTPHKIRISDLDNMIIESIIMQVKAVLNIEKTIKQMKKENAITNKKEYEDNVIKLQENLEKIKKMKRLSYENWKLNKITKEEFLSSSNDYSKKISKLNKEKDKLNEELEKITKYDMNNLHFLEEIKKIGEIKELNRLVIEELIEDIVIEKDNNVKIIFKCEDKYFEALDFINRQKCDIIASS